MIIYIYIYVITSYINLIARTASYLHDYKVIMYTYPAIANSIHKCLYLEEFLDFFFLHIIAIIVMHDIKLIMTTVMIAPIIIGSRFELEVDETVMEELFNSISINI